MKNILLIGDPHFKVSNPLESHQFHDEVLKNIKNLEKQIDFIVILGDILDTHEKIHMQPFCRAINFLKMVATFKRTFVLIGNHDRINNNVYMTDEHPFSSLKDSIDNLIIVDKTYFEEGFCFVPYVPNGRFLEAIGENFTGSQCFFAHQEFLGCKMGGIISENGDEWDEENPPVFSGHIHEHQRPQKNIIYTGTPFQHSFSDDENKGLFLLKFESKESWNIEKIELEITKKKSITMNISEFKDYKVPKNYLLKIGFIGDPVLIKKMLTNKEIKEKIDKNKIKYRILDKGSKKLINNGKTNNFCENLKKRIESSDSEIKSLFNEIYNN